jgi:hypothetical protein
MAGLSEIMKHCMYIGMADDVLALAQCKTRLYVLNVVNLRYLLLKFHFYVGMHQVWWKIIVISGCQISSICLCWSTSLNPWSYQCHTKTLPVGYRPILVTSQCVYFYIFPSKDLAKFSILFSSLLFFGFFLSCPLLSPFFLSFCDPLSSWGFWSSPSLQGFVKLASIMAKFSSHYWSCERNLVCWLNLTLGSTHYQESGDVMVGAQ